MMAERGSAAAASGFNTSRIWLAAAIVGIVTGGVLKLAGQEDAADIAWAITTVVGIIPMAREVVTGLLRREPGVDVIALLAMLGALALEEYLAGAVIALMLSTGEALEAYADRRAHRELSALLERAPRTVNRYEGDDLVTRPIEEVAVGDRLMVKTGEVVPVDGVMLGDGVLDESALTGESRPVERPMGDLVRSGAVNAGPAFDLRAIDDGRGEHLRRDRALGEGGGAGRRRRSSGWPTATPRLHPGHAGDRRRRLAAVRRSGPRARGARGGHAVPVDPGGADRDRGRHLAARPAAASSSRAAARWRRSRRGKVLLFDKTGTLTSGHPAGRRHRGRSATLDGDELLRLAASLDQVSPHVLATAIVARRAGARPRRWSSPTTRTSSTARGSRDAWTAARSRWARRSSWRDGAPLPERAQDVRRRTSAGRLLAACSSRSTAGRAAPS